jgi:hypothetical protein
MIALYMFINPNVNSAEHRAEIVTPGGKMFVVGVKSALEGAILAKQYVKEEGVNIVELCGGFGYEGGKAVYETVGDEVPVGIVMHHVWSATKLTELLKEECNDINKT